MNILFICLGNICRSPLAEEVFRQKVKTQQYTHFFSTIDSAGMIDYHEGNPADSRMRKYAAERGFHLTHLSRPMTKEDFEKFDLIVAMDQDNLRRLKEKSPSPEHMKKVVLLSDYLQQHTDFDHIPDPYYGTAQDFRLVIDLCEDACEQLLIQLKNE